MIGAALSILLPEYNTPCVRLVRSLRDMCEKVEGLEYEIIVLDDCSKYKAVIEENEKVNELGNCKFVRLEKNVGSGAVRNALAKMARHEWLLFMDCDVALTNSYYIRNYLEMCADKDCNVVNGGITIGGTVGTVRGNIRYMYEKAEEHKHTANERRQRPYQAFRSTNFLVRKSIMTAHPFDERLRRYEDVLFGKEMHDNGIEIKHISNPVMMGAFEHNGEFIAKVEKNLDVLYEYRNELEGYSPILSLTKRIRPLLPLVKLWHRLFGPREKQNLTGYSPSLRLLRLYQLGYYVSKL